MSYAGLRRSGRSGISSSQASSSSAGAAHDTRNSFSSTQPASASHNRRSSGRQQQSHLPPPPPPPPPPQPQQNLPLLIHDADRNYILTPLTPGVPTDFRSRSQQYLDGLSAAVLMYVLNRHAGLLPIKVSDINSKVLRDTARGAGRVVLKDVARRLKAIFGLRLVEADKQQPVASAQRAGAAGDKAKEAAGGRKRGRSAAQSNARSAAGAAAAATSVADSYIVVRDQPFTARDRQQQQEELSSDGTDATTPTALLSSWRAHSALLLTTLALCAFTYKDGIIAEERLMSLLAGLFGLGSAREMRDTSHHMLFGDVHRLVTHTWVEQHYMERVTLQSDWCSDFAMYGATSDGNNDANKPHFRVGVRARLEIGHERLYRFMVEDVMDSDVSEAGVKEMQRRDAVDHAAAAQQGERKAADDEKSVFEEFAFSQPAPNRRSSATISLPNEQNAQRVRPYHQAVLRYLLAHSVAPESAVLAFYKQCNPPSARNPSLDELYTAINEAIEWAALRIERVASEYADERVWMIVSRSDADTTSVFSAFSSDELALFRAWLQTLVTEENHNGTAALTLGDMHAIAAGLDGLGKERAKRLAEGSRELADRLAAQGWLHKQKKIEPQPYSIGMRAFIELLKPRALAAAAAAASSASLSSSSASVSSAAAGGLTLRLYECGKCRFDVYYGLYCGTQQDEHAECRQKYHYHCVQRVRQSGHVMKCRANHAWKPARQRHAGSNDAQEGAAVEDGASVVVENRGRRHNQRSSQSQQRVDEHKESNEPQPQGEQQQDDDDRSVATTTRRTRLRRG